MLNKVEDNVYEVPQGYQKGMRVPGRIFISDDLLDMVEPGTIEQVANVATLPGIVKYSMAMPDAHLGYGFPIGGVAAFREEGGVISPGGVGFDINCGVRLLRSELDVGTVRPLISDLIETLFREIPSGVGATSRLHVSDRELTDAFLGGSGWAVEQGFGTRKDVEHCEEQGCLKGADPAQVSLKARKRGRPQFGTLGSGNHFLEIQRVSEIYDSEAAKRFGLFLGQVTVMIHCGSRGAGHQICTDHLGVLSGAVRKYGIELPDKQLACAPIGTPEAKNYFGAMACAANYAWANRQIISHWTREVFGKLLGEGEMPLVYDVAHNVAKVEEHQVDGKRERLYVHRKGATRSFGPSRPEVPASYSGIGQPLLIPGSMGTPSYVLCGQDRALELTFGSACHGSGRIMSRTQAKKTFRGTDIKKALQDEGIKVVATEPAILAEEAPGVYKPSRQVVDVVHNLGIARKVAQLVPLGVSKG
ncbi:MAG: tRNA-splicing ligase RtcB [Methanosaeta sp. PtaB.Bin039]|nr:MAG: tRNA-splicing ligase RtcB [Methanosaeta sp. PtaB.Bin039]HOT07416.1 RtcB family protein [Methanotrichaceae archaeon]HQF17375.1 RtcB family protein [Methanotrichaceae archaeon]HQI91137.1 RtcB family protein [Methanotrichaceae archaeon]HQJ29206.1 RtcB family protein [Methanotrichaceae archaeon]